MELNTHGPLTPPEAQRGLLEIAIRMRLMVPGWKDYTHLRCEVRGGNVQWILLDADDDSVYRTKIVHLGAKAAGVAGVVIQPYPPGELTRITITFMPPRLSIDVLDDQNNVLASEYVIDLEAEDRVRRTLTPKLNGE